MKTREFIKLLERNGWTFLRHGANHDIYIKDNHRESIPRHPKMSDELAKAITKRRNLK